MNLKCRLLCQLGQSWCLRRHTHGEDCEEILEDSSEETGVKGVGAIHLPQQDSQAVQGAGQEDKLLKEQHQDRVYTHIHCCLSSDFSMTCWTASTFSPIPPPRASFSCYHEVSSCLLAFFSSLLSQRRDRGECEQLSRKEEGGFTTHSQMLVPGFLSASEGSYCSGVCNLFVYG